MDPTQSQPIQGAMQQQSQPPTPQAILAATNQALLQKRKQQLQQPPDQNMAAISQAMATLDPNSPTGQIGAALDGHEYDGLCQGFVDDKIGAKQRFPSAIDTWNAKIATGEAHPGLSGVKPGDVIEFAPDSSNQGLGHAALVTKDGNLQMATYSGVKTVPLDSWVKNTGQQVLGFYRSS